MSQAFQAPTSESYVDLSSPTQTSSDQSVGELLSGVTRDLSTLMRQEVELAKAELRQEASTVGKGAGMLGAAGLAGHMVLLFLSLALWWALSNVMDQSWGALIVAVLWGVAGAILYKSGRKQLATVKGPQQTMETVKEIPDAVKGNA